ncbi:MAG TPA: hypothetical protein VN721_17475 [Flavipsychrobacter sp.]|nr:hypothetical protein [Flavipsychrobacter sp.]
MKRASKDILINGLLFSHLFIYQFEMGGSFLFKDLKIQVLPLFSLFGFSFPSFAFTNLHTVATLNSSIIGYTLFLVFLLTNFRQAKRITPIRLYISLTLCTYAVIFELITFWEGLRHIKISEPLRFGPLLFLLTYRMFEKMYFTKNTSPKPF